MGNETTSRRSAPQPLAPGKEAPEAQPPVAQASAAPRPPESGAWVTLARLLKPQGRKGELLAEILTDFPERFSERKRLFLLPPPMPGPKAAPPREVTLEEHWLHKDRLVLKFAGIDSINDAEPLRGAEVVIPSGERAPLEDGAVYIADLLGCTLYDRRSAAAVGVIVDVDRESANMELLVVRQPGGAEALVPFANAYEPKIDLAAGRMEMTLPEGLLTLESPLSPEERAAFAAASGSESAGNAQEPGASQRRAASRRKRR